MDKTDRAHALLPCFCPAWDNSRVNVCRQFIMAGFICREFEARIAAVSSECWPNPLAPSKGDRDNISRD